MDVVAIKYLQSANENWPMQTPVLLTLQYYFAIVLQKDADFSETVLGDWFFGSNVWK